MSDIIKSDPRVHVGIMDARVVRFELNGPFVCRGREVTGGQAVAWAAGSVEWQGERCDEWLFVPKSESKGEATACPVKAQATAVVNNKTDNFFIISLPFIL